MYLLSRCVCVCVCVCLSLFLSLSLSFSKFSPGRPKTTLVYHAKVEWARMQVKWRTFPYVWNAKRAPALCTKAHGRNFDESILMFFLVLSDFSEPDHKQTYREVPICAYMYALKVEFYGHTCSSIYRFSAFETSFSFRLEEISLTISLHAQRLIPTLFFTYYICLSVCYSQFISVVS